MYRFFLVIAGLVDFDSFGDSILILFWISLSFDLDLDFDPLPFHFVVGGEPSGLEVLSTFSGLGIFSGVLTVSGLGFLFVIVGGSEGPSVQPLWSGFELGDGGTAVTNLGGNFVERSSLHFSKSSEKCVQFPTHRARSRPHCPRFLLIGAGIFREKKRKGSNRIVKQSLLERNIFSSCAAHSLLLHPHPLSPLLHKNFFYQEEYQTS